MSEQMEVTYCNLYSELLKFLFAADLKIQFGKFEPLNPVSIWNNMFLSILGNWTVLHAITKEIHWRDVDIVCHEQEKFLGKIIQKSNISVQVWCLEKLYGIHETEDNYR